jgi:uncharacterized protein
MGPLVPDIIGNELNLVIALLLGASFGFVLEQAGFSSTKKLANLFYGRDFVVLKVFFTAAITAMAGIVILSHFGLLNIELIYVNPTYLYSSIVGGVIMGIGFIIGGFCPGTSVCAAAIGKIDAAVFLVGIFLGVFIFAEGYPLFEGLYNGSYLGNLLVYETLGISKGLFAFLLVLIAIIAFVIVTIVEKRVKGEPLGRIKKRYLSSFSIALFVGILLIFLPDSKTAALNYVNSDAWKNQTENVIKMSPEEVAYHLTEKSENLLLIDVRSSVDYKKNHIPSAINIPLDSLANFEWREVLSKDERKNIFYASDMDQATKAGILSSLLGDQSDVYVVDGGIETFNKNIMFTEKNLPKPNGRDTKLINYRLQLRERLLELRKAEAGKIIVVKKKRKVQGGC